MFKLKMRKVEFFKGDRELPWWFIPFTMFWVLIPMGEAARILQMPDPVSTMLYDRNAVLPWGIFIATVLYVAWRYLSRWLVFILVPLLAVMCELIWCNFDIASFSMAQWGIVAPHLVIVFWVVIWLIVWIPPYFIIKLKSNVPSLLVIGGIAVFMGVYSWVEVLGVQDPGPSPFLLCLFLIASGVACWRKPDYITKLKSVPFLLIFLGIVAFIGMPSLHGIGLFLGLFLIASGVAYWYKRRHRKRKK